MRATIIVKIKSIKNVKVDANLVKDENINKAVDKLIGILAKQVGKYLDRHSIKTEITYHITNGTE